MRKITIDCDLCGVRIPIDQGKEALIKKGSNDYHLFDLCSRCLDDQLQNAASVNDTEGFRQRAAALISRRDNTVPERKPAT